MLALHTLGELTLTDGNGRELLVGRRKELVLLAYVARRRPRAVSRGELIELLWGERPEAKARASLRQALLRLRNALGDELRREPDGVSLSDEALELDLTAFERALNDRRLADAVALWHGDFLHDAEDVGGESCRLWIEEERERFRKRLSWAFEQLVTAAFDRSEHASAVRWAERWTQALPLEERAHAQLVRALRLDGRIGDARGQYAAYVARHRDAFASEPSPQFLRLVAELESPVLSVPPGTHVRATPKLVGRGAVLAELSDAWARARAGQGAALLIESDEGMGKTALVEAFLERVSAEKEVLVLRASATMNGKTEEWATARALVTRLADAPGLIGASPTALAELSKLLPQLREDYPGLPAASAEPHAMRDAIVEAVLTVAAEVPVVVCLDDLDRADEATSRCVAALATRVSEARVLVLFTARPGLAESAARIVRLAPLTVAELRELVHMVAPMDEPAQEDLAVRLHRETEGNPRFALDMLAAMVDEHWLVADENGRWTLTPAAADRPLPMVASMRAALARRLAAVTPEAREVAETMAVSAAPADVATIARVRRLSVPSLYGAIDELVAHRVIVGSTTPGESAPFAFAHETARRAIVTSLSSERREALQHAIRVAQRGEDQKPHRRRWAVGAALLLVATVSLAWVTSHRGRKPFADRGWIVLADFDNRTPDSAFNRSLDAALAAGLVQSAYVNVLPRPRVRETLGRMDRNPTSGNERLDESLARDVAQREGIPAVIAGSIDRVDNRYMLTLRLIESATGTALAAETRVASSRATVLDALDDLVRDFRREIGESASAISRHDVPLPRATTRSIDALRKYAEGLEAWNAGRRQQADELFRDALTLDSNFALAHAALGQSAYWSNDPRAGDAHFARALSQLDGLTARERFQVRASVESWRGNREQAIEIRRALLAEYPDDRNAWGQIGYDYMRLHRPNEAIDALRRELAIDSTNPNTFINIASSYKELRQYDEALRFYHHAFVLRPSMLTQENLNQEYGTTLLLAGKPAEARAAFDTMLTGNPDQRARGHRSLGVLAMYGGQYADAIDHFREAATLTRSQRAGYSELRNRLFLALCEHERGGAWRDSAKRELETTYRIFHQVYLEPVPLMFLGKAMIRLGVGGVARAQEIQDSLVRRMHDNPPDRAASEVLAGEIALARGRAATAVSLFQTAYATEPLSDALESLANGLAAAGDLPAAARYYEQLASQPTDWIGVEVMGYAGTADPVLARVYERLGDTTRARLVDERFLKRWSEADTGLLALRDVRLHPRLVVRENR